MPSWKKNESTEEPRSLVESQAIAPLTRLHWDFDRMLNRFFEDPWGLTPAFRRSEASVRIEVEENEEEVVVKAEVPGVGPKDLNISIEGDVLELSGEKRGEETRKENGRTYTERVYGSFRRRIGLPMAVETDKVRAEHKNGVVTIHLPKAEVSRPKRIEINAAD